MIMWEFGLVAATTRRLQAVDDGTLFAGWGLLAGTTDWRAVSLRRQDFLQVGTESGCFAGCRLSCAQGVGVDDLALDEAVRALVRRSVGREDVALGPIRLLSHPRYFGYCFNPAAFFYVFDLEGKLECVVIQVTNTPW
jgi:hypothetical protein